MLCCTGVIKSKPFPQKDIAAAYRARRQVSNVKSSCVQPKDYYFTIEPTDKKQEYQFVLSLIANKPITIVSDLKQHLMMSKFSQLFKQEKENAPYHWTTILFDKYK